MRNALFILLLCSSLSSVGQEVPVFDINDLLATGLPLVEIETVDGEMPTCDYVDHPEGCHGQGTTNMNKVEGRLVIRLGDDILYDSGDYLKGESGMTIRVRGNSSAYSDKKPYKVKLQKKADLLGRGDDGKYKDKDWLLLKENRLTLNTQVGLKVNELVGMQWTPSGMLVNVVLNGDYRGVYMLSESVKRNEDCRLNVSKSGYVFEYDPYWWNEDVYFETGFTSSPDAKFTFKEPDSDDITEEQIEYLRVVMETIESSLSSGTYPEYIDVPSFTSWLLAQDILGNYDGHGSNVFMTKYDDSPSSKVMMGNLWDFDAAMKTPGAWSNSHRILYYGALLDNGNPQFVKEYKKVWKRVGPTLAEDMERFLDEYVNSDEGKGLDKSIPFESRRWGSVKRTVAEMAAEALAWFQAREPWLDNAVDAIDASVVETRSAAVPSSYYDLHGRRHSTPPRGITIVRMNDGQVVKTCQARER